LAQRLGRRSGCRPRGGPRLLEAAVRGDLEQGRAEDFTEEPDGSITVDVRQMVHDARTGDLISDSRVRHRYRLVDGLVVWMDVLEPPGGR
jgi:hypothetical protein